MNRVETPPAHVYRLPWLPHGGQVVAMVAGKPGGAYCMIQPGGEMARSQMCSEQRTSGVSQNEETWVSI